MKPVIFLIFLSFLACNGNSNDPIIAEQSSFFSDVADNDYMLEPPKEGEWLFEHKEKGQTFEDYTQANPIRPTQVRSTIYLMPIGDFTPLQLQMLRLVREYIAIFFQQQTTLMPQVTDRTIPAFARRMRSHNNEQLHAQYILDSVLKGKTPSDGIALMAISAKDLYPSPDWNYVFGLASYADRVGVTSIYRLQGQWLDSTNFKHCLRRLINVSSHEIGHMLSMHHCTFARCTMNGSNSLEETDTQPNRLCSNCQKKLFWNFQYNNQARLKQLIAFFESNGLKEDGDLLKRDLEAIN